ncbi:hypothetical protein FLK61_35370 [Paenalkalicoccus suaedae]|uniref:Uncharacterized protein n=1 Tax=Paenalkalicoccus suaedae TaxID=2592382 RepID=A0A859FGL2_9BACI|nr:hypothetical protein [Paenalkalicoccus suaedae]QKS71950.1 hypothetical protein FLK61_35370 [Paenalkalicoccus suaedae]
MARISRKNQEDIKLLAGTIIAQPLPQLWTDAQADAVLKASRRLRRKPSTSRLGRQYYFMFKARECHLAGDIQTAKSYLAKSAEEAGFNGI